MPAKRGVDNIEYLESDKGRVKVPVDGRQEKKRINNAAGSRIRTYSLIQQSNRWS